MKRKITRLVLAGGLLAMAGGLRAQEPPPPPGPGPDMLMPGGPMAGRVEILGFAEMHPGKVVSGAPYSAVAIVETKQTLSDGTTIDRKTQTSVFRDSQGRMRRETTMPAVGPLAADGQPKTFILIFDPVASAAYAIHPDQKIADQLPAPRGRMAKNAETPDFAGKLDARMEKEIANGTLKKDDLGTKSINGVAAQGTRYTHTIPAGQIGNDKPIVITSERWYSPDLQIVLLSTRNDPRFGQTTYSITSLQRQEPPATLFTVPSDYTVQQAKPGKHRKGPGGPGAPGSDGPAGPNAGPGGMGHEEMSFPEGN